MLGLGMQNFLSAAAGTAVVFALIRDFARHSAQTIGNFWADLYRVTGYLKNDSLCECAYFRGRVVSDRELKLTALSQYGHVVDRKCMRTSPRSCEELHHCVSVPPYAWPGLNIRGTGTWLSTKTV